EYLIIKYGDEQDPLAAIKCVCHAYIDTTFVRITKSLPVTMKLWRPTQLMTWRLQKRTDFKCVKFSPLTNL
ncbi:hypothetical protein MKW98_004832, partial [Papaver atlanticum]